MANLMEAFKNPGGLISQKLKELDPELDTNKGGVVNQLLQHFINKRVKVGNQAAAQPVSPTMPQTPTTPSIQPQTPQIAPQKPTAPVADDPFVGLNQIKPPKQYHAPILKASEDSGLSPSLIAAVLWNESGYNPKAVNGDPSVGIDRGIAQINSKWHPEVSDEQANDPVFAISWMAKEISRLMKKGKTLPQAIASYNVGEGMTGGGAEQGRNERGLGEKGEGYISRVKGNLNNDYAELLGL